jgi:cysteine sulfinate desulfinase/cysteine desulfurase-like protein
MGLKEKDAYASIRFSLGRFTRGEEIEKTILRMKHVLSYSKT